MAPTSIRELPGSPRVADDALRASEIRYRRLFETARDGILILDAASGTITSVNPFLANLLGYDERDILGKKLWEISPFEDVKKSKIAFKELQDNEYIRYDDLPLETHDGRSIDVEFISNLYLSDQEHVIQCNIREISGRKEAEKARQSSDLRFRALFECSPDGILIADRTSRYIDCNPSLSRMLGYSRREFIGMHAADIVVPEEAQHIGPALAIINAHAEYEREWQLRRKDGSVLSADVMAMAMRDGNLLAVVRDITARKQVDEALRAAEERMRFALLNAQVGIWDLDYTSGIMEWSNVLDVQYDVSPGTFGGTFEAFIQRVHPEDRASVLEVIGNAASTGTSFSVQHRTARSDGPVRWLSGTGRVFLDERGQPLRAIGVSQDVTERHMLEAQVQQAQKMEAVGRLAGGVAHDFNNLLTVILGFCDLLLVDGDPDDPRNLDIAEIQRAGTRGADLTRQLLAFGRKQIIEPTVLDLNAILTEMRPMLRRLLKEDVKVVFGVRPGLARFKADRGQVEQVVLNLAVNAQDAMPQGGTLTIETANVDLDEHYAAMHVGVRPGAYVALTVTDSGTGITPDVRERLFEPFFTTKELGKGTGLGLATVHGIVMRSGGSVNVYTEVGHGTSFKVYFPEAAAEMAVQQPVETARPRTGTETVLVVEDSEGLRELTKRLLQKQGYTVVVAANATDARQLFDEYQCDVLLTDVVMPGTSGPELTRELVQLRPELKVIYMSGYTDEAIVQHGVLKPGIAFLHKPFTGAALGQKIREALDR